MFSAFCKHVIYQAFPKTILSVFSLLRAPIFVICTALFGAQSFGAEVCKLVDDGSMGMAELARVIRSEECGIKRIDDVLAKLPESVRSRFVLFYRSQSLQGPHTVDYQNPRAILATIDIGNDISKKIFISFNGKSSQPGYQNLEVLEIDQTLPAPHMNLFKYFDIQFPKESSIEGLSWQEIQKEIQISKPNPAKCVACHGNPARPIFQSYPIWQGAYGSFHLNENKTERKELDKFVERTQSDPSSRYHHLVFKTNYGYEDTTPLESAKIHLLSGSTNLSFNMSLSIGNSIRVARLIQKNDKQKAFRPAVLGAMLNCSGYNDFFPERIRKAIDQNLYSAMSLKEYYSNEKIRAVLKNFYDEGEQQFGGIISMGNPGNGAYFPSDPGYKKTTFGEFLQRQKDYWDGSHSMYLLWIDTLTRQGRQRSEPAVAKLRYILEGRGIDISNWFIDLKQPTYRINDLWSDGMGFALAEDDKNLIEFKELARKANHRFDYTDPAVAEGYKVQLCQELKLESRDRLIGLNEVKKLSPKSFDQVVRSGSYPSTFLNTCSQCHVDQQIGPHIPFNDKLAFNNWVSRDKNKSKLIYRLTTENEFDRMPLKRNLSEQELSDIFEYIKLLD